MPQETVETLLDAFITSRLDYSNALFYGLLDYIIYRLQSVQNAAAKVATRFSKHNHTTPILHDMN